MPIYEYVCSACQHRLDILHGVHDAGPAFCPSCGAEGTMRKAFAPPTIHFKGTGWAKKERRSASSGSRRPEGGGSEGGGSEGGGSGSESSSAATKKTAAGEGTKAGSSTPAPAKSASSSDD
ncbi:MAG TPA: zinc ribbon domain-containing protein [Candidatus Limnocylindrales bacterium]|nr:zinc ribbon domain-containing protein [Candidatus Limnocylindrales bacterium]